MIDLTFLTTNPKKLANFRYLARGSGVRVLSFHERTFHASYNEPILNDREEILKKSYYSALGQWKKAGLSEDEFFFFEDTSVAIDALSEGGEFPGVNIKFWMRDTSFSELDRALKSRGNNRSVTVRSDVILHVPPRIRRALNIEFPFKQFTGVARGHVCDVEVSILANLTRPWQDSTSFNKWYIPAGETLPFSALEEERAREKDFRAIGFNQLLSFIDDMGLPTIEDDRAAQQLFFKEFPRPEILVICGPTCAGKTTAADYLVDEFGYMHFEASDFMRAAFHELHGRRAGSEISKFASLILEEQPWTVPSKIIEHMVRFDGVPIVVTGFRSPLELDHFIGHAKSIYDVAVAYVDADELTRYERARKRKREDSPEDFEQFKLRSSDQMGMGLSLIKARPEIISFDNSGSKHELHKFAASCAIRNNRFGLGGVDVSRFGSLEIAIISVLGGRDESSSVTTTEIAALINAEIEGRQGTAKDNVSRYFNQRISPFYLIVLREGGHGADVISYSVTQTGNALWKRIRREGGRPIVRQSIRGSGAPGQQILFED